MESGEFGFHPSTFGFGRVNQDISSPLLIGSGAKRESQEDVWNAGINAFSVSPFSS